MTPVRSCPRCRRSSLVPTGAYWSCATCAYAITQAALCFEYDGIPMRDQQIHGSVPVETAVGTR